METEGEDTNQLVVELVADIGVEIKLDDISVSHRLPGGPRSESSMQAETNHC